MEILCLLAGFLGGCLFAFLILRAKNAAGKAELNALRERLAASEALNEETDAVRIAAARTAATLETLEKQAGHDRELLEAARERELQALRAAHAKEIDTLRANFRQELAAKLEAGEERARALERSFSAERDALKKTFAVQEEFKTLSSEILKEKTGRLSDLNREQLSALLKPLQEKLGDFKSAVDQAREKGITLNSELKEQIAHLMSAAKQIGANADNLASALKGNNKTQGCWGEMILEEILVSSGLKKGVHYECQETLRDDDGNLLQNEENRMMRPDVIVHYPDGKDVVIDSKVSLSAYTDYMNAETDGERENALARHTRSVRSHVEELVRKNYASYIRKREHEAVDFVIMFIPNEASHQLAMIRDPGLWRWAFERKVMIVSPVNLMALLQLIQIAWTRTDQERNQQKILDTAATLLDRLYSFYEQFDDVGRKLDGACEAYRKSLDRLKGGDGKHSVVLSGERLKQLGVKMKRPRQLPGKYQAPDLPQLESAEDTPSAGDEDV